MLIDRRYVQLELDQDTFKMPLDVNVDYIKLNIGDSRDFSRICIGNLRLYPTVHRQAEGYIFGISIRL